MRTKLHGWLSVCCVSALLSSGCGSQSELLPGYSLSEVSTQQVEAASKARRAAHAYALYDLRGLNDHPFWRQSLAGTISFDLLENKIFWDGRELTYLLRDDDAYLLFDESSHIKLRLNLKVRKSDGTGFIDLAEPAGSSISRILVTEPTVGPAFVRDVTELDFPTNRIGLIATTSIVDGAQVELKDIELVCSLEISNNVCRLDLTPEEWT